MKTVQYLRLIRLVALLLAYHYLKMGLRIYRIFLNYVVYPLRMTQLYTIYYIGKIYIHMQYLAKRSYLYAVYGCALCRLYVEYAILVARRQVLLTIEFALALIIILLFGGCANVTVVEAGAGRVQVISLEEAEQCEQLTETTVKVVARVSIFKRSPDRIKVEAENVARNIAKEEGGNAVAPLNSLSEDGEQEFGIYQCANKR